MVDSFEFSSIHFSGRDENLTFTQLEQRGWLRSTENLTSNGSLGLLSFMPKFEAIQYEPKSCILLSDVNFVCDVFLRSL